MSCVLNFASKNITYASDHFSSDCSAIRHWCDLLPLRALNFGFLQAVAGTVFSGVKASLLCKCKHRSAATSSSRSLSLRAEPI